MLILKRNVFIILSLVSLNTNIFAADFLHSMQTVFFNNNDQRRVGLEVEFIGLNPKKASEIVAKFSGGKLIVKTEKIKTTIKETKPDGTIIYNEKDYTYYVIENTPMGKITMKPDANQLSDTEEADPKQMVTELVSEPVRYKDAEYLQTVLNELKAQGALGTNEDVAIANQVNAEVGAVEGENIREVKFYKNLIRDYYYPRHSEQINERINAAVIRKRYINPLAPKYLNILLDPNYNPTLEQFFMDYFYRQSLELLGEADFAWNADLKHVKERLLSYKNPIVPTVVKLNEVRLSSLFAYLFPEDPLAKLYVSSGWVVARPLVEFREWNNDFDIVSPVKQSLGLMRAVHKFGYFDHDHLMAELSNLSVEDIERLRTKYFKSGDHSPYVYRYFAGDHKKVDAKSYYNLFPNYENTVVGFLDLKTKGVAPVILPGESVVMHRYHNQRHSVLGKYNPGLVNFNIQQALENKYVEFEFWNKYFKGSMAETVLLKNILGQNEPVDIVIKKIKARFPKGFVIKNIWELGSERLIVTDLTDITGELSNYLKNKKQFDKFEENIRAKYGTTSDEIVNTELKKHKNYLGQKIYKLFENPYNTLIQERLDIDREYRVEVVGGKVLGDGSTVDRWEYEYFQKGKMNEYVPPKPEDIAKAEAYAQKLVDSLPKELNNTPFGMDIAILKDGSARMIESNPGANSTFLYEEGRVSILVLQRFLEKYPKLYKEGKVNFGMMPDEQMKFLGKFFKEFKIDTEKLYPNMKFEAFEIVDPELSKKKINKTAFLVGKISLESKKACEEYLKVYLQGKSKKLLGH